MKDKKISKTLTDTELVALAGLVQAQALNDIAEIIRAQVNGVRPPNDRPEDSYVHYKILQEVLNRRIEEHFLAVSDETVKPTRYEDKIAEFQKKYPRF